MQDFLKVTRLRKAKPHERPNIHIDLIEPFWNIKAWGENNIR